MFWAEKPRVLGCSLPLKHFVSTRAKSICWTDLLFEFSARATARAYSEKFPAQQAKKGNFKKWVYALALSSALHLRK